MGEPGPVWAAARRLLWALPVGAAGAIIILASFAPHGAYFDAQVQLGAAQALLAGESPYGTYYQSPLWTAFFLAPFALMPSGAGFVGWFWANVAGWAIGLWLLLAALPGQRTPAGRAAFLGVLLVYPPLVWSTHGQMLSLMAVGMGLFAVLASGGNRRQVAAGASLSLLLVKPHLALFPLVFIGLWGLRTGRAALLAGMAGGGALLVGSAFLVQPSWLGEWVHEVSHPPPEMVVGRALYAPTATAFSGLWLPGFIAGPLGSLAGVTAALATARWVWRHGLLVSAPAVMGLSVAVLFLITPYAQGYDLALLLFCLAPALAVTRPDPRRRWTVAGLVLGVYLLPPLGHYLGWAQTAFFVSAPVSLAAWAVAWHQARRQSAGHTPPGRNVLSC